MLLPPHRNTSPPIDQQPAAGQRLDALPSCPHRPLPRPSPPSGGNVNAEQKSKKKGRKREPGRRMPPPSSPVPCLSSVPSDVFTDHTIARSSLPSSYAVPVILRPDLVRSLSSVRPPVFLFLVPRSPSCRLTAKPSPAAHYLTRSHPRHGCKGSSRPVLVVIPSTPPRHRPATGTGGPLPASPSPSVRW